MKKTQLSPAVTMRQLMAATPLSRNAFADPAIPTFADLIARVKADPAIPKRRQQNWVWALNALARSAEKDPAAIPAHPEFLRGLFRRAAPASVGLKQAAWNNVRHLIRKVLDWAGLASMPGHYQAPFALSGSSSGINCRRARTRCACSCRGSSIFAQPRRLHPST